MRVMSSLKWMRLLISLPTKVDHILLMRGSKPETQKCRCLRLNIRIRLEPTRIPRILKMRILNTVF